jgi:hypothetical protein
VPFSRRGGQFCFRARTFQEQASATGREKSGHQWEQTGEWRQGASGDKRGLRHGQGLGPAGIRCDGGSRYAGGFAEKGRFAVVGFDKGERQLCGQGERKAWKAGAAPEVDGGVCFEGDEWRKLERVDDVTLPDARHLATCDQIQPSIPRLQEGNEAFQAGKCFT